MIGTWIQRGQVLATGMPWREDLDVLVADGVRALVSLTERLPDGLPHEGLKHLHLPVRDFHPPTIEQIERAVVFMDETIAAGGAVAVHCGAGLGRTGTFCAAWLTTRGFDPDAAIREVRRLRPGSVETREQADVVVRFARSRSEGTA